MQYTNKIYLSGGLTSNWQKDVVEELKHEFILYNPRDHELDDAELYTAWDLYHIKIADIVFAFMEEDNPSGYGLSLELGYAAALGKTIILVDEKSHKDEVFAAKFKIVRESASATFSTLTGGIHYLKKFVNG